MPIVTVTDQMGFNVNLPLSPRRIISLVPSQTEFLYSLQLDQEVCGITKFCIHPPHWYQNKTHVGGTKRFDFHAIQRLAPDLIIGNKEENYQEGIDTLKKDFPVWMSDICNLDSALDMMIRIGSLTQKEGLAGPIVERIREDFSGLKPSRKRSVLYLIWRNPWMAAGRNTFIHDMLVRNGLENVVQADRYPLMDEEEIRGFEPEYVFLSSEPFPFREIHIGELAQLCPRSKVILVDGEMFSWYGSRLLDACNYFRQLPL